MSPHGRNYGPEQTESHFSPQSSQVKPDVSNVSSQMPSSSHPKFINQEGLDVEEELSETESQAAARKEVEEMDMEACLQDVEIPPTPLLLYVLSLTPHLRSNVPIVL